MRCLSTFSGCGWAYGFTFTQLPPLTLPQICESWLKSYLMQVCKPCHYALVDAVEPFKLHPMPMSSCNLYMRCLITFSGCGWAYDFTLIPLPPQTLLKIITGLKKGGIKLISKLKSATWALLRKLQVYVQLNQKATVQTGFEYLILTPLYVEVFLPLPGSCFGWCKAFFAIARFLFWKVRSILVSHNFHVRNKYASHHLNPSPAFRMVWLHVY